MKKTMIALSLLGLSSTVYASKARLLALGQDKDDNYFVQDSRSIFHNAAYVNEYGDTLTMEWGKAGLSSTAAAAQTLPVQLEANSSPHAIGGMLKKSGDWTYGVYLGNESNTSHLLRASAESTANNLLKSDNIFDLFVGKDMGSMKLGWNFLYSDAEDNTTASAVKEQKSMATRLGMIMGDIEAYANVSLKGESSNTSGNQKFDGSLGVHLGGAYNMGDHRFVGSYKSLKWDITNAKHTSAIEAKYNQILVGYGNTKKVSDSATVYTQVFVKQTDIEAAFTTTNTPAEMKHMIVPLVVGFEAKANDWLTWRGSVTQYLHGNVEEKGIDDITTGVDNFTDEFVNAVQAEFGVTGNSGTTQLKKSLPNSTVVAGGASLTFGKLIVDGMIGTTSSSTALTQDRNAGSGNGGEGLLSLDTLMTRVGVTYSF